MPNVNVASGASPRNTHDFSLSDGNQLWGGILDKGPQGVTEIPQSPSSLLFNAAASRYGDFGPGFSHIEQLDWSGGRGLERFVPDPTRFYDSQAAWTLTPERLLNGPQWKLAYQTLTADLPGSMEWHAAMGIDRFQAVNFTSNYTGTAAGMYIWLRRRGQPGTLTLTIRAAGVNPPAGVLQTVTLVASSVADVISVFTQFLFSQAFVSGTAYWLVVAGASTDDVNNHWEIGCHKSGSNGQISALGSSWSASTYPPYYLLSSTTKAEVNSKTWTVFELEGAQYAVDRYLPDMDVSSGSQASALWMQGDRGNSGDNTADKTKLNQSNKTRTWAVNQWQLAKVKIIAGPGRGEWRSIISNTSTVLTVFPAFDVIQTTATRYVIYDVNDWALVGSLPASFVVTSFVVLDNICYFACGSVAAIRQFRNNPTSGANEFNSTEVQTAGLLQTAYHPDAGFSLFRTHPGVSYVSRAQMMGSDELLNGTFDADTNWTKGGGWTIAGGVAIAAAATSDLSQTVAPLTSGLYYKVTWQLITRTAGSVQAISGLGFGASRTVPGTYSDILLVTATGFLFRGVGFTGTIDNVTCQQVLGQWGGTLLFGAPIPVGNSSRLITNLIEHDDQMYVLKEDSIWRIQNDRPAKVNVGLDSMPSLQNGIAALSQNLFLYFSWVHSVERLYGSTLDDVGPWKDAGLPAGRAGPISCLLPVIGWLFAAIDGGPNGTSSILAWNGKGWHELFRGWEIGRRVRNLTWVPVTGGQPKLYFNFGSLHCYLTFPQDGLHPQRDLSMPYQHESVVEAATLDMDRLTLPKFVKQVELITENAHRLTAATGRGREIYVDAQVDDGIGNAARWLEMGSAMDSPVDLVQLFLAGIRQIRLRFRLNTNDVNTPVVVKGTVTEMFARTPVKYQWNLRIKLSSLQRTKTGQLNSNPDDFMAWLKAVSRSAARVRMRAFWKGGDDIFVVIEPPTLMRTFNNAILGWWGGITTITVREL